MLVEAVDQIIIVLKVEPTVEAVEETVAGAMELLMVDQRPLSRLMTLTFQHWGILHPITMEFMVVEAVVVVKDIVTETHIHHLQLGAVEMVVQALLLYDMCIHNK